MMARTQYLSGKRVAKLIALAVVATLVASVTVTVAGPSSSAAADDQFMAAEWEDSDGLPVSFRGDAGQYAVTAGADVECFGKGDVLAQIDLDRGDGVVMWADRQNSCALTPRPAVVTGSREEITICSSTPEEFESAGSSVCITYSPIPIVIAFFNGVLVSRTAMAETMPLLKEEFGDKTRSGARIIYEPMYNPSSIVGDLLETFTQRVVEHGAATTEAVDAAGGPAVVLQELFIHHPRFRPLRPEVVDAISAVGDEIQAWLVMAIASAIVRLPPFVNSDVYDKHLATLHKHLERGRRIVFVAHSQGNLFMNQAYRSLEAEGYGACLAPIHVAPATGELHGPHFLASHDRVIGALGLLGGTTPPVTHTVSKAEAKLPGLNGKADAFKGHGFVEVYLNRNLGMSADLSDVVAQAAFNMSMKEACHGQAR